MWNSSPTRRAWRGAWVPTALGMMTALGIAMLVGGTREPLLADVPHTVDSDHDGVPDGQEIVLGTHPGNDDTDGDGFLDGEEVALQTSPVHGADFPRVRNTSIGMSARGEGGLLRLFVAVYTGTPLARGHSLRFAAIIGGKLIQYDFAEIASMATVTTVPVAGGRVIGFDIPIRPELVLLNGSVTFFVVIGDAGNSRYSASASVDLTSSEGILIMRRDPRGPGTSGASANNVSQGTGGTLFQPIPQSGGATVPTTWAPERICFQQEQLIAVSGAFTTSEVVEADCVDGWDSYCAADCSMSVGSTHRSVDPGALIGN